MLPNPYYTAKTEKMEDGFDESGGMRYNKARKRKGSEAQNIKAAIWDLDGTLLNAGRSGGEHERGAGGERSADARRTRCGCLSATASAS